MIICIRLYSTASPTCVPHVSLLSQPNSSKCFYTSTYRPKCCKGESWRFVKIHRLNETQSVSSPTADAPDLGQTEVAEDQNTVLVAVAAADTAAGGQQRNLEDMEDTAGAVAAASLGWRHP